MATGELPYLDTRDAVQGFLIGLSEKSDAPLDSEDLARQLDGLDQLAGFRGKFHVPTITQLLGSDRVSQEVDGSQDCVYLTGNSLGLQPKGTRALVNQSLDKWAAKALDGHMVGPYPWYPIEDILEKDSLAIVGAKPGEVVAMNGLTVNCHLAMVSFYQPTKERFKILLEDKAFPSDYYGIQSQIRLRGYDPEEAMLVVSPRPGEHCWRTEDIVKVIEEQGDSIALIWLPGVHYITGYFFDMETITRVGRSKGCYVGFDLAHAAGNVELALHDWGVDVAAWCSYKYLNGGPGGIAGFFVHERHAHNQDLHRLTGWWSHRRATRMAMSNVMELQPGALGWQLSNPPVLEVLCLKASYDVFSETNMRDLVRKSRLLTGYLELLVERYLSKGATKSDKYITLITTQDPQRRGAQLSLKFSFPVTNVEQIVMAKGARTDLRGDGVMRVAPAPLYNSFHDIWRFFNILKHSVA